MLFLDYATLFLERQLMSVPLCCDIYHLVALTLFTRAAVGLIVYSRARVKNESFMEDVAKFSPAVNCLSLTFFAFRACSSSPFITAAIRLISLSLSLFFFFLPRR
jgi:hypothetical protein